MISNNEKEFIIKALQADQRVDGRGPFDHRNIDFQFSLDDSSCTLRLGRTMVLATITASLEPPYGDRHSEGSIRFNILPSPMAGPTMDTGSGRPSPDAIELGRIVERSLRESRAVDVEALCVQAGRRVWHLEVDIRILDHDGNMTDAAGLAALGALCAFRRPDVTVDADAPGGVKVHPISDREPVPLTIHHLPLPVTFAFFENGDLLAVDPLLKEEATSSGMFTIVVNPQGEVCAAQKARGIGVSPEQLMRCFRIAADRAKDIAATLRQALDVHDTARVAARVKRRNTDRRQSEGIQVADTTTTTVNAGAGHKEGGGKGEIKKVGMLASLPDDIRRFVEHAAAGDSVESSDEDMEEESEKEEESEGGEEMDLGRGENDTAGVSPPEAANEAVPVASLPAQSAKSEEEESEQEAPSKAKKKIKKAKRRRAAALEGSEDQYAAIAELIAGAASGGGDGSLTSALKRKP